MRFSTARAFLFLLLPAAVAVGACDDDDDDVGAFDAGVDGGTPSTPAKDSGAADDGGVHATATILHVVQTVNLGEITQGTLAQSKAMSPDVTSFAAMMVSDHTAASQRVTALAQQLGVTLEDNEVSQMLKSNADAATAQLQGLSGHPFDVAYIDAQVLMHAIALETIDGQLLPNASDPAVRAELTTTRASVAMHHDHARSVQQALSVDGGADAGDAGDAGN